MSDGSKGWSVVAKIGNVMYDFAPAATGKYQIAVKKGERVCVMKASSKGWYRGYVQDEPERKGIFPASYVELTDEDVDAAPPPPPPADDGPPPLPQDAKEEPASAKPVAAAAAPVAAPEEESVASKEARLAKQALADMVTKESKQKQEADEKRVAARKALTGSDSKLLTDLKHCVRQWDNKKQDACHANTSGKGVNTFINMMETMGIMCDLHKTYCDQDASAASLKQAREQIILMIESNRKVEEGYMVVRNQKGVVADFNNTSLGSLLRGHRDVYSNVKQELGIDDVSSQSRRVAENEAEASTLTDNGFPDKDLALYLEVQMCIFSVGEPTDLYFSLYDGKTKKFISEDYHLRITAAGMPANLKFLGKMKTIFTSLYGKDFADLYLVCKIYRIGNLVYDPKNRKPPPIAYRRPFGCACMSLTRAGLEKSLGETIAPPNSSMTIYVSSNESNFVRLHEMIIAGDKTLDVAPKAKGIALNLGLFHGKLQKLQAESKTLDPEEVSLTPKLRYEAANTTIQDQRDDLYVTICDGRFERGNKRAERNIEFVMRILRDDGSQIEECMYAGQSGSGTSDAVSVYKSCVFYHSNTPQWQETIRLVIPSVDMERAHILICFNHVSTTAKKTNMFSFAFMPLCDNRGCVIPNRIHGVETFKPPAYLEKKIHTASYLKDLADGKLVAKKETVSIHTQLISCRKTQNPVVHPLLHYGRLPKQEVKNALSQFKALVNADELATYVRNLLASLFGLLSDQSLLDMHEACFSGILRILELLADKKLGHYLPLIDGYITDVYDFKLSSVLIQHTRQRLQQDSQKGASAGQSLRSLCKTLQHMLRLIVRSKELEKEGQEDAKDQEGFKREIGGLMELINRLVTTTEEEWSNKNPKNLISQKYVIREYPSFLEVLQKQFNSRELGEMTESFLSAIGDNPNHSMSKLTLARFLLNTDCVQTSEGRDVVMPSLLHVIHSSLRSVEQNLLSEAYLGFDMLISLMEIVQTAAPNVTDSLAVFHELFDCVLMCTRRLQLYMNGEIECEQPNPSVTQLCEVDFNIDPLTVLCAIANSMTDEQLGGYLDEIQARNPESKDAKLSFVQGLLTCFLRSVQDGMSVFPEMWISLIMGHINTIVKLIVGLRPHIIKEFTEETAYAHNLWSTLFALILELFKYPHIQSEKFTGNKKEFIQTRYGDLRKTLVAEMEFYWMKLSPRQKMRFVDVVVPDLFALMLRDLDFYNVFARDIYFDMLCVEFRLNGNCASVERYTIDELYEIVNHSAEEGKAFVADLQMVLAQRFDQEPDLTELGQGFLSHILKMYNLMNSFLTHPKTDLYEDERTYVALQLIEYLQNSGHVREEMQTRYIQYLVDLHVSLSNFVEAGYACLSQTVLLHWIDDPCAAFAEFPAEPQRERKERIYRKAAELFTRGEDFEQAVKMQQHLQAYFQEECDYVKLAQCLTDQAELFRKMETVERFYPSYFRVVYHGKGFNEDIQEKEFVYRGTKLEPVMDFTNRIKRKFPQAKILMSSDKPKPEMYEEHDQIISITTLTKPAIEARPELLHTLQKEGVDNKVKISENEIATANHAVAVADRVPPNALIYNNNQNLRMFEYSKGLNKSKEKKPANEFKDLWVLKTIIYVEQSMPTNRRRCEVVHSVTTELLPIENAVTTVSSKNVELVDKVASVDKLPKDQKNVDVGPLSMNLNGILDAAVNGGTQKYIEAFLPEVTEADVAARRQWKCIADAAVDVHTRPGKQSPVCSTLTPMTVVKEVQVRHGWLRCAQGWTQIGAGENVFMECEAGLGWQDEPPLTTTQICEVDLKDHLREQVIHLRKGLNVFVQRAPETLLPLSQHLEGMYQKMSTKLADVINS